MENHTCETYAPLNRAERRASEARARLGKEVSACALPIGLTAALNTEQASLYTGLAEKTLEGLRCRGGGPKYIRYGRKAVRYFVRDLDDWMIPKVVGSTSEVLAA